MKYSSEWRLYVNMAMLRNSPKRIGEMLYISVGVDNEERVVYPHPQLLIALEKNSAANEIFNQLSPSLRNEIIKYIAALKTEQSVARNVSKAIGFLLGNEKNLLAGKSSI